MSDENEDILADAAASGVQPEVAATSEQPPKETEANSEADPKDQEAPAEEDDGNDDESQDGKPKRSRSARMRRQIERLQAENAQLRVSAPTAPQDDAGLEAVVKTRVGEKPKEGDYADWFEYQSAVTAYEADVRQVRRQVATEASVAKEAQQARVRELADDFQENLEVAAKEIPDLMPTLKASQFKPAPLIEMLILDAGEKAPLVAYHLAKNPKVAASLNAMSPIEAAREMGRIEARVAMPKPKTATNAAPPLATPKGSAVPSSDEAAMNAWLKKTYGSD